MLCAVIFHDHLLRCRGIDPVEGTARTLDLLRSLHTEVDQAYTLVQQFAQMLRMHTEEQLNDWLERVKTSQILELRRFVLSVERDKETVIAGLTLSQNNGPLEGNVNRLKLIKRSMYGRAEFDLLKLRVLSHRKKSQDRKNKRQQKSLKNSASSLHTTTTEISQVA